MTVHVRSWLIHFVVAGCFITLMMILPFDPGYFVYVNAITFFVFLVSLIFFKREQTFLAGCMVIPLAVMVGIATSKLPDATRVLLYYGTLLAVGLSFAREYISIRFHLFTLPRLEKMFFFTLLGVLVGMGIAQLLLATGQVVPQQIVGLFSWKALLVVLPIMAIAEELIFRRIIQNESEKLVPAFVSIVITSMLYAVLFAPLGGFFVFVSYNISLILGILYMHNRRISLTGMMSLGIKIGCIAGLITFLG